MDSQSRRILMIIIVGVVVVFGLKFYTKTADAIVNVPITKVTVTVYNNTINQTNNDPTTTASGFRITEKVLSKLEESKGSYGIVAVSRDLLVKYPFGSIIEIENKEINKLYGKYFVVLDTLNERYTNYIDILIKTGTSIGKWEDVIIYQTK